MMALNTEGFSFLMRDTGSEETLGGHLFCVLRGHLEQGTIELSLKGFWPEDG